MSSARRPYGSIATSASSPNSGNESIRLGKESGVSADLCIGSGNDEGGVKKAVEEKSVFKCELQ